jgi:hypothetical protein
VLTPIVEALTTILGGVAIAPTFISDIGLATYSHGHTWLTVTGEYNVYIGIVMGVSMNWYVLCVVRLGQRVTRQTASDNVALEDNVVRVVYLSKFN